MVSPNSCLQERLEPRNVHIIRAGGTIDRHRGLGDDTELTFHFPSLANPCRLSEETAFPSNPELDSSNMAPCCWQTLANLVGKEIDSYDGLVITHGTDTLTYTGTALAFMVRKLNKPLVLTGSMVPKEMPYTDAWINLYLSANVAAYADISEVVIVFGNKIYRPVRCLKASKYDYGPYISMGVQIGEILTAERCNEYLDIAFYEEHKPRVGYMSAVEVDTNLEENVELIKCYPGMGVDKIHRALDSGCKGLVLEAFGSGFCNTEDFPGISDKSYSLLPALTRAKDEKVPIVLCSEAKYGPARLVGRVGDRLRGLGVITVGDMLPEVAWIKLMWIMGHTYDLNEIRREMLTNYVGEITAY